MYTFLTNSEQFWKHFKQSRALFTFSTKLGSLFTFSDLLGSNSMFMFFWPIKVYVSISLINQSQCLQFFYQSGSRAMSRKNSLARSSSVCSSPGGRTPLFRWGKIFVTTFHLTHSILTAA